MKVIKGLLALVVASILISSGCGGAGVTSTGGTADFFQLAIVPDQTVTTSTFEVQAIAELLNPSAGTLVSPSVIDGSGNSHVMSPKVLQWPGTTQDSITIWSATIPLVNDQVNSIKVMSGTKKIDFSIRQKSSLSVLVASNSTQLVSQIQAAIVDPTIDVIQVAYNEPDLGAAIHNAGNNFTNQRTTWLTIKPASGNTISWVQDSTAAVIAPRPFVNFLHLSNVTFGSDTSDGGRGTFYVEANHHVWVSASEFRGKYKYTWNKTTSMTVAAVDQVRGSTTEGQKIYFTDCLWDGTASTNATFNAALARDLQFNSHRGDINNFGKVVLNVYGQDIETILIPSGLDSLHNDGFQIWGNMATSDLIFKGMKIVSPHIPANIQPFLLDSTFTPDYSYVLIDSVTIEGAAAGTVLMAQMAGKLSNSRISNYSIPNQNLAFRYDLLGTNSALNPTNVYLYNMNVKKVLYVAPAGGTNITYDYQNVSNTFDISNSLRTNSGLSSISFSNIKVASGP